MPSIYDVAIEQVFSFEVYPVEILGNVFKNVRLEGIVSARTARAAGVDIDVMHRNVYPSLPAGTPDNPDQYNWIRIQNTSGQFSYVGVPYLREDTITVSSNGMATLTFYNMTQRELDRVLNALSANGRSPDDVSFVQK